MRQLKPALQYSQGRSYSWSGAELVNCFAEKADGDKREEFALMCSPGLTVWATVGVGPIRGAIVCASVLYVVSGGVLFSVASNGTATTLGSIGGTGPVRIACNYSEVCVAAGGVGYVYSGGTLQTPVPFDVSDVIYADGYIIWQIQNSEQFIISSLDDALTYDASDISSVEGAPDDLVGMINDHREIHFYGGKTGEIYYNSGAALFPFERQGNAFIERGCFDRDSIVKIDSTVMFVGDDKIIYALAGYQPQRVSTHAIEYQIRNATYARGWTYTQEGHKFYVLETDSGTFVLDRATGAWHKRQSYGSDYWRCYQSVDAYGMTLFGDRETGKLYIPSMDVYSENGDPIRMEITLPTLEFDRQLVTMYAFEVTTEAGVGSATSNPEIVLQYSDDSGRNWSNEMARGLGLVGQRTNRAVWRKLGQFRIRTMKLAITEAVQRIAIAYWADIR